ncbi:hypothetical protein [Rhizobium sp. CC-YZS058]|uniref:hypothetical protein n=1 Tax=Rhizobium sp. CC-YZS058 TaxID=3042153 RepID=UPI002B055469|nr:hypothetical protein [Rhizobium sp. CC-YZS058]MEA3533236.1 hypothetical protein [Rhizobium sp. CC-YZS058]
MAVDISGTRSGTYQLRNISNETVNFLSGAVINASRGAGILASSVTNLTLNLDGFVAISDTYARSYGVQVSGNGNALNVGTSFGFSEDNPNVETGAIFVNGSNNFISNYANLDYREDIRISGPGNLVSNFGLMSKIEMSVEMSIANNGQLGQVTVMDGTFRTSNLTTVVNDGEWGGFNNSGSSTKLNAFEGSSAAEIIINNHIIADDVRFGAGNDIFRNNGGYMGGLVFGGAGDDTFILDRGTVRGIGGPLTGLYNAIEYAGEGVDTVILTEDFINDLTGVFQIFENVEDLILMGVSAGKARGNSLDNALYGSEGKDFLDGADGNDRLEGAGGADTLIGGAGIDTAVYLGNQANYVVTQDANGSVTVRGIGERAEDGTDTLSSIEKLAFSDGTIDLNTFVNVAPVITSNGGGATALIRLVEGGTSVTKVQARAEQGKLSFSLSSSDDAALFTIDSVTGVLAFKRTTDFETPRDGGRDNIYNVTVIASNGAKSDQQDLSVLVKDKSGLTLSGSSKNDVLRGTSESDVLSGGKGNDKLLGGAGNDRLIGGLNSDVLTGGSGKDTFVFNAKLGSTNIDKITDFTVRSDSIQLDDDIFKKVGKIGDLASSAFWTGAKAHDANDRIVYDKKSGTLWYDQDGNGAASAVQIAQMSKNLTLSALDFEIVA